MKNRVSPSIVAACSPLPQSLDVSTQGKKVEKLAFLVPLSVVCRSQKLPKAETGATLEVHHDHVALLWRNQLLKWLFYGCTSSYEWLAPVALLNRRGRRWQLPLLKEDWRKKMHTHTHKKNQEMRVYCLASKSILFHAVANLKYYCTLVESHQPV